MGKLRRLYPNRCIGLGLVVSLLIVAVVLVTYCISVGRLSFHAEDEGFMVLRVIYEDGTPASYSTISSGDLSNPGDLIMKFYLTDKNGLYYFTAVRVHQEYSLYVETREGFSYDLGGLAITPDCINGVKTITLPWRPD